MCACLINSFKAFSALQQVLIEILTIVIVNIKYNRVSINMVIVKLNMIMYVVENNAVIFFLKAGFH